MDSKSSLTFSFCGDYEVNALSLSRAIMSLVELSSAVAEREFPDVEFRMNVKAVTPGSLKFDFVAAVLSAQTLLSADTVEYAANLIDVISSAFSIKKFLKGKGPRSKEDSGDKIIIINDSGAKMEIQKSAGIYFIDNRVDKSITNIINAAKASDGVTGISVDAHGVVDIQRDEFDACATEIELDIVEETHQDSITSVRYNEVLFIRQADFSGELKWKFTGDQNITATVLDPDFQEMVKAGKISMSSKTYIIADVQVKVFLTTDGTPDTTKPIYDILKVHSVHTVGEGQTRLDV